LQFLGSVLLWSLVRKARMKLLVLGATGRTGLLLLSQTLARGHSVVAVVRRTEALNAITKEAEDKGCSER